MIRKFYYKTVIQPIVAHTITIGNVEHGTITASAELAFEGASITITATPDVGYELRYLTVNGNRIVGNTFIMPNYAVELNGEFYQVAPTIQYLVSLYKDPESITATLTGAGLYDAGSSATLLVSNVQSGWEFYRWSNYGANPLTITINSDTELTTYFKTSSNVLLASISNTSNSDVTVSFTQFNGNSYSRVLSLSAGWSLDGMLSDKNYTTNLIISGSNIRVSAIGSVSGMVMPVTFDSDINAYTIPLCIGLNNFPDLSVNDVPIINISEAPKYTLTLTADNGSVTGSGTYYSGTSVVATVTPDDGYEFVEWGDGTIDNPRTFVVTQNKSMIAYCEPIATGYSITIDNHPNSTVTASATTAFEGDTVTFTAVPDEGYSIQRIAIYAGKPTISYTDLGNNTYEFTMPADDVNINVTTEAKQYTITATCDNGTVTGGGTYYYGETGTLEVTPNSGYTFSLWNDGNTDNPRTITVTLDASYLATCSQVTPTGYSVILDGKYAADLSVAVAPVLNVLENSLVDLTLSDVTDMYALDHWEVIDRNGNFITVVNSTSPEAYFLMPANDVKVYPFEAYGAITFRFTDGSFVSQLETGLDQTRVASICGSKSPESIAIGNYATNISGKPFENYCSDLTQVSVSKNVNANGSAFSGCSALLNVYLEDGLTTIGTSFCRDCVNITDIELPNSISSVGSYAFYGCSSLNSIVYDGTKAEWNLIQLGDNWASGVDTTVVQCSDGDVNI